MGPRLRDTRNEWSAPGTARTVRPFRPPSAAAHLVRGPERVTRPLHDEERESVGSSAARDRSGRPGGCSGNARARTACSAQRGRRATGHAGTGAPSPDDQGQRRRSRARSAGSASHHAASSWAGGPATRRPAPARAARTWRPDTPTAGSRRASTAGRAPRRRHRHRDPERERPARTRPGAASRCHRPGPYRRRDVTSCVTVDCLTSREARARRRHAPGRPPRPAGSGSMSSGPLLRTLLTRTDTGYAASGALCAGCMSSRRPPAPPASGSSHCSQSSRATTTGIRSWMRPTASVAVGRDDGGREQPRLRVVALPRLVVPPLVQSGHRQAVAVGPVDVERLLHRFALRASSARCHRSACTTRSSRRPGAGSGACRTRDGRPASRPPSPTRALIMRDPIDGSFAHDGTNPHRTTRSCRSTRRRLVFGRLARALA